MKLSDGSTHSVQTQQQQHQLIYFLLPSCLTCFCSFFFYILMRDREEKVWRNVLCWFESSIESTRNTQKSGKKIKQNTHTPFSLFFFKKKKTKQKQTWTYLSSFFNDSTYGMIVVNGAKRKTGFFYEKIFIFFFLFLPS